MPLKFESCYAPCVDFSYEIFDRIILNGYIQKLQRENKMVYFLRELRGIKCISKDVLKRLTGEFIQRVELYTEKRGIPLIRVQRDESKLEAALRYDQR